MAYSGLVPVLIDCELDTFCIDVARIEQMITPRTGALLFPNLIGNAPDWDAIRSIADRHGLPTIEDSCDTLGPLRKTKAGEIVSSARCDTVCRNGNVGVVNGVVMPAISIHTIAYPALRIVRSVSR